MNMNEFEVTIKNLSDEIAMNKEILDTAISAPIANYSGMPGGGTGELTTVEAAAANQEARRNEISLLEQDYKELSLVMLKVKRALASLGEEEREILTDHYVNNKKWTAISLTRFCSITAARQKAKRAIAKMALAILILMAPFQVH